MNDNNWDHLAFVHPTALKYGKISIGECSSLWAYSVMRSEIQEIIIGKYCNIQDFVMIHIGDKTPVIIGDYCSIAHKAVIHGAEIGNNCLIGVGAVVMDGCVIGDNSLIGAGTYLPAKTIIPSNSIVTGNPGVVTKTRNNFVANRFNAMMYYHNALGYKEGKYRVWADPEFKKEARKLFATITAEYKKTLLRK